MSRAATWTAARHTGIGWPTPGRTQTRRPAAWGRRAHRLEPDPETAAVVGWMFAQRLAGHSVARSTRALNDAAIPCPSATDPKRNESVPAVRAFYEDWHSELTA